MGPYKPLRNRVDDHNHNLVLWNVSWNKHHCHKFFSAQEAGRIGTPAHEGSTMPWQLDMWVTYPLGKMQGPKNPNPFRSSRTDGRKIPSPGHRVFLGGIPFLGHIWILREGFYGIVTYPLLR